MTRIILKKKKKSKYPFRFRWSFYSRFVEMTHWTVVYIFYSNDLNFQSKHTYTYSESIRIKPKQTESSSRDKKIRLLCVCSAPSVNVLDGTILWLFYKLNTMLNPYSNRITVSNGIPNYNLNTRSNYSLKYLNFYFYFA